MDVENTWILSHAKNCCQFSLLTYILVSSPSSRLGGVGLKGAEVAGGIVFLACCVFYFIREHEIQVKINPFL